MTDEFDKEFRGLCEQLLKVAEGEKRAFAAYNVDELETFMRRKQEIIGKLGDTIRRRNEDDPSQRNGEAVRLLSRVIAAHESVRDAIKAELDECQQAIIRMRMGRQARRAYHRAGRKGNESPGKQVIRHRHEGDAYLAKP